MAEILIKIKIEGNSHALAFVERTQPYLSKTLKEITQDIVSEVGELLPEVTITDAPSKKCKISLLSREVIFK